MLITPIMQICLCITKLYHNFFTYYINLVNIFQKKLRSLYPNFFPPIFLPAEILRLFSPYPARSIQRKSTSPAIVTRKIKKSTYTHLFFRLAKRKDCGVPSPSTKNLLEGAGLGEKKITVPGRSTVCILECQQGQCLGLVS